MQPGSAAEKKLLKLSGNDRLGGFQTRKQNYLPK